MKQWKYQIVCVLLLALLSATMTACGSDETSGEGSNELATSKGTIAETPAGPNSEVGSDPDKENTTNPTETADGTQAGESVTTDSGAGTEPEESETEALPPLTLETNENGDVILPPIYFD